jgi:hypothetical protein
MSPTRVINKLKHADQFKLMKLVEAEFTERRQTDDEFAVYATEKLGFQVKGSNVFGAREALGIESSRAKMSASSMESRLVMVESETILLRQRLAYLEELVNAMGNQMQRPHGGFAGTGKVGGQS